MRLAALVLLVTSCSTAVIAVADPVCLNVQVRSDHDQTPLGGVYLRLVCEDEAVDLITHTDADGRGTLEFATDPSSVTTVADPTLRLLPAPRPNPAAATCVVPFVQSAGKARGHGTVALFDLRGRCLARGPLVAGDLALPPSGLPAGVYLLRSTDHATGVSSTCRITAARGPLRRIRLAAVPEVGVKASPLPLDPLPARLTVRLPGHREQVVDLVLVAGDQDLEVDLESLSGDRPLQTWLFAADHGWNAAAVDSGWIPAVADTGLVFARSVIDTDGTRHVLAQVDKSQPDAEFCSTYVITARSASSPLSSSVRIPIVYFDFGDLPEGVRIEQASLIVSPAPMSAFPCGPDAWHAAALDIWREDTAWLQAPVSESCDDPDAGEHYRRVSWKYADSVAFTAWWPPLDKRHWWRDFGILSRPVTQPVTDGHACRYDVTRALQAWSDHRHVLANAGFVLTNTTVTTTYAVAAGPAALVADRQPMLLVSFSEGSRTPPWQGYPLAFSFQTDDGDTATQRYSEICDQHGVPLTAFAMRRGVSEFHGDAASKLTIAQWRDLVARGHEIGHHSDHHLPVWGLAEITWGEVDSMAVELARDTWLAEVFPDSVVDPGPLDLMAYPSGGVSLWAIKNLVDHGFVMGRAAGAGEFWSQPPWGRAGRSTYLSWYEPVNLFNVAVIDHAQLVGLKDENLTPAIIRERVRRVTGELLNQGQSALLTFSHSTKNSPYARGMDYDELDWLLSAVAETELYWMTSCGEITDHYRRHHLPAAPGDSLGYAAYDSLISLGHPEFLVAWWLPAEVVDR